MFSSSQKCVLYLTDDALYVYKVFSRSVHLMDAFDWEQEGLQVTLTRLLKKGFTSVVILNDTVDQHYRKERIPKVGALDASSVIKRRLAMAFPEFPIRSFQKISDDSDGKEGGRVMGHFLFCACPDNSNIRVVTSSIRDSGIGFKGVALLPMESVGLVTELVQGVTHKKTGFIGKKEKKNENTGWSILMGQNASGGLRQIVVKNGQLALTRISPIVETDADMALWCDEVRRELDSTMGYLSRFGYKDTDSLNIVIIGSEKSSPIFDKIMEVDADIHVVSLDRAMKMVGISASSNELEHIANVLHVGWVSKKTSLSSPMRSGLINSIIQPRTTATAVAAVLVLGLVGSMYYFANSVVSLNASLENLKIADARKKQVNLVYDKEIERKEALGINIKLIQSSFDVHNDLDSNRMNPLDTIEKVGRAMKGTLRLDSVSMQLQEPKPDQFGYVAPRPQGRDGDVASETILKFSFPGTIDIIQGNNQVIAFSKRLEEEFGDATVVVTRILKDVSYRGEMQSEIGVIAQEKVSADLEAEIVIKQGGA